MGLTIQDMHRLVEQDVQKMGFAAYKDFETEEIDLQLNRQMYFLIDGILDKHFGRTLKVDEKQGFSINQVTLDNLRNIQIGYWPVVLQFDNDNTYSYQLPANYYHFISSRIGISYKCWENDEEITHVDAVNVRVINSQNDFRSNPFYKTGRDSPTGELLNNTFFIFTDRTFTITHATLSYIRQPVNMFYAKDVNGEYDHNASSHCDLDASLHYMLVNMTSLKIQEIIESNQQKIVNSQREIT